MHQSSIFRVLKYPTFPFSQTCSNDDVICTSRSPNLKSCPVDTCSTPSNPPSHREANVTLCTKLNRLLIRCTGASLGCSWKCTPKDEPTHMKEVCITLTNFCCVQSFLSVAPLFSSPRQCTFQSSPCPQEVCVFPTSFYDAPFLNL